MSKNTEALLFAFRKLVKEKLLPYPYSDFLPASTITPETRQKYRKEVDALINSILDADSEKEILQLLSKTPPEILLHYADRLALAEKALLRLSSHFSKIQMKDSDYSLLLRKLLFP